MRSLCSRCLETNSLGSTHIQHIPTLTYMHVLKECSLNETSHITFNTLCGMSSHKLVWGHIVNKMESNVLSYFKSYKFIDINGKLQMTYIRWPPICDSPFEIHTELLIQRITMSFSVLKYFSKWLIMCFNLTKKNILQ